MSIQMQAERRLKLTPHTNSMLTAGFCEVLKVMLENSTIPSTIFRPAIAPAITFAGMSSKGGRNRPSARPGTCSGSNGRGDSTKSSKNGCLGVALPELIGMPLKCWTTSRSVSKLRSTDKIGGVASLAHEKLPAFDASSHIDWCGQTKVEKDACIPNQVLLE